MSDLDSPAVVQSTITSHLASYGFVVVGVASKGDTRIDARLKRPADLETALNGVLKLSATKDPTLSHIIDPSRIAVAGSSAGGMAALKVAETDPRVIATLLLASNLCPPGFPDPLNTCPDPGKVSKPVMFMAGDLDSTSYFGLTEYFYSRIPTSADRWYILVHGAGHQFRNDCLQNLVLVSCDKALPQPQVNAIMGRWVTAFFLRYAAGDSRYDALLESGSTANPNYDVIESKAGSAPVALPTAAPLTAAPSGPPVPVASARPGAVLLADNMADPRQGILPVGQRPGFLQGYGNGEYVILDAEGASSQIEANVPGRYADASIAVDARLDAPAADQYIELSCRVQFPTRSGYELQIVPEISAFELVRVFHGIISTLTAGRIPNPAASPGSDHIQLSCRGDSIVATINGTPVASVSDGLFRSGLLQIGVGQEERGRIPGSETPLGGIIRGHFGKVLVQQQ